MSTKPAVVQDDLYANDKETSDAVSLNVRMPRQLRDQFQKLCESRGIEMSKVVRRLVEREVASVK